MLDDEPGDAPALAALDVLYGRLGRWEPYADILRRRMNRLKKRTRKAA